MNTPAQTGRDPANWARRASVYALVAPVWVVLSALGFVMVTPVAWENWFLEFAAGVGFSIAAVRTARQARHAGASNKATAIAVEAVGWAELVVSTAGLLLIGAALYGLSNYRG